MNKVDRFIQEIRDNPNTSWVALEIEETLAAGVSTNVEDAIDDRFFQLVGDYDITTRERNKRKKYGRSRPFTEDEKIEVIHKMLEVVYLELPAIRVSTVNNFTNLGINFDSIVFSTSNDEIVEQEIVHRINPDSVLNEQKKCTEAHRNFLTELIK